MNTRLTQEKRLTTKNTEHTENKFSAFSAFCGELFSLSCVNLRP